MTTIKENIITLVESSDSRFKDVETVTAQIPTIRSRIAVVEDDVANLKITSPTKIEVSASIGAVESTLSNRIKAVENVNVTQGTDISSNRSKMLELEAKLLNVDAVKSLSIAVDDAPYGEVASGTYNADTNMVTLRVPQGKQGEAGSGDGDVTTLQMNTAISNAITPLATKVELTSAISPLATKTEVTSAITNATSLLATTASVTAVDTKVANNTTRVITLESLNTVLDTNITDLTNRVVTLESTIGTITTRLGEI